MSNGLQKETLYEALEKTISAHGSRMLTVRNGREIPYEAFLDSVRRIAAKLCGAERIMVDCSDGYCAALGILAAMRAKATVIPVNAEYGNIDVLQAAARPNVYLRADAIEDLCNGTQTAVRFESGSLPDEKVHAAAAVLFTSGSTGTPKGVCLSADNIRFGIQAVQTGLPERTGESFLLARPLSHVAAFMGDLLAPLCQGLRLHFFNERFHPVRLNAFLAQHGIRHMNGTPTLLYHMVSVLRNAAMPLKTCVLSGERLLPEVAARLQKCLPDCLFYNALGLTECSGKVSILPPADFVRKAGSIGKPVQGVRCRIENDELLVQSPGVMQGYLGETTCHTITDGWLHTGDAAYCDEEGYLFIAGRLDERINRAGVKVYPQEIERVILQYPSVAECLVYGESDIRCGQRICAKIRATDTRDRVYAGLTAFLKEKLPPHMHPAQIEFVESLAKTPSGKLKRSRTV